MRIKTTPECGPRVNSHLINAETVHAGISTQVTGNINQDSSQILPERGACLVST
jgi:hypothetical protein